jgi:hypothetical protein
VAIGSAETLTSPDVSVADSAYYEKGSDEVIDAEIPTSHVEDVDPTSKSPVKITLSDNSSVGGGSEARSDVATMSHVMSNIPQESSPVINGPPPADSKGEEAACHVDALDGYCLYRVLASSWKTSLNRRSDGVIVKAEGIDSLGRRVEIGFGLAEAGATCILELDWIKGDKAQITYWRDNMIFIEHYRTGREIRLFAPQVQFVQCCAVICESQQIPPFIKSNHVRTLDRFVGKHANIICVGISVASLWLLLLLLRFEVALPSLCYQGIFR